jgi:hypothetical protein
MFISDDRFIEYANVSGTTTRYLSPETGEVEDYGDDNLDGSGESEYECPHCMSNDIEFEWEGTEEESKEQRKQYEEAQKSLREQREQAVLVDNIKNSEWDLETNAVHK